MAGWKDAWGLETFLQTLWCRTSHCKACMPGLLWNLTLSLTRILILNSGLFPDDKSLIRFASWHSQVGSSHCPSISSGTYLICAVDSWNLKLSFFSAWSSHHTSSQSYPSSAPAASGQQRVQSLVVSLWFAICLKGHPALEHSVTWIKALVAAKLHVGHLLLLFAALHPSSPMGCMSSTL